MPTPIRVGGKRSVPKKTTKKRTVNSSRLSTTTKPKKQTAIKKKTTGKKVTSTTKKTLRKTTQKKISQKNLKKSQTKSLPRTKIKGVLLLNIISIPHINIDTIAIQTARIGGLSIIVVGAFFTLLFSQYIWSASSDVTKEMRGVTSQMLAMIPGTTGMTEPSTTTNPFNPTEVVSLPTTEIHEPPATFSVEQEEPLSGEVAIFVHVPIADQVKVLVFEESYTNPIELGFARQVQPEIWRYDWDTTLFDDASYKIVADISNVYTAGDIYRNTHSVYLEVNNNPSVEVSSETPTSSSTQATILAPEVDEQPEVELVLTTEATTSNTAHFLVTVEGAQKVTLFASDKASESQNILGRATQVSDTQWSFQWDTSSYAQGEYVVTTRVTNEFGSYVDGKVHLTVSAPEDIVMTPVDPDLNIPEAPTDPDVLPPEVPKITLKIPDKNILTETATVEVDVLDAQFVELWAIQTGSTIEKIVGLAQRENPQSSQWKAVLKTRNIPNGEYTLFARVKNNFGTYESQHKKIKVYNAPFEPVLTDSQKESLEEIEKAQKIEKEVIKEVETDTDSAEEHSQEDSSKTEETEQTEPEIERSKEVLDDFSQDLEAELRRLTTAYRSDNPEAIARAEARITRLKEKIVATTVSKEASESLIDAFDKAFEERVTDHKQRSEKIETIIKQRVGDHVFKDSDSDGVSDYDEQTLYGTDPYSADSDGDGFNDGSEIQEGYDPLDVKRETTIVYESPKEKGVIREDILVIESIEPIIPDESTRDADGVPAQAVISGRALPNSFVTLYIYSTPTIVTVKTEPDGSWRYRFDRELEDGEHSVYVGVTDNAGRIVAKSAPFRFIKEAQAFSPIDTQLPVVGTTQQTNDSMLSTFMIYLILSISLVSIGLVLILLGLHLETRQKQLALNPNTS